MISNAYSLYTLQFRYLQNVRYPDSYIVGVLCRYNPNNIKSKSIRAVTCGVKFLLGLLLFCFNRGEITFEGNSNLYSFANPPVSFPQRFIILYVPPTPLQQHKQNDEIGLRPHRDCNVYTHLCIRWRRRVARSKISTCIYKYTHYYIAFYLITLCRRGWRLVAHRKVGFTL